MEQRNRNVLISLIAVVIAVAVFSSFGLPYFSGPTATITLPTPQPSSGKDGGSTGPGITWVEVTPETVQSVIAAMDRAESYARSVSYTMEGKTATVRIWVDGGWTRTELSLSGAQKVHTIVGQGKVWRWYEGDRKAVSWQGDANSADLEGQHLPTYEDVLELETDSITAAGYEEKDGVDCVYVEARVAQLGQRERYWICPDNGLLTAAETRSETGELLWSMTSGTVEIPVSASASFALPDGTVLHRVSRAEG